MIRFSKTTDSNLKIRFDKSTVLSEVKRQNSCKIWIFFILFVACLFMTIGAYAQSKSNIEREKVSEEKQDLKMVADVLDGFGGKSESDNFKMQNSAGGQPSPTGRSQSTAFKISAGYAYATFVLRGDPNNDGSVNISDVVYWTNYLFVSGSPPPVPLEAGDVNCNGSVNVSDVVYLINYLFVPGSPPPC